MITSGANESMEVIAAALLSRGDRAFVEEPGYPSMWHTLADLGLETAHIPVDDEGIDIGRAAQGPGRRWSRRRVTIRSA